MLMECAATLRERWQWNTHTHTCFSAKTREGEKIKKQTWVATIIRGMRRRSEWAMTDCWAPSALAAMRCDYAPLATCHMPHAAWLHDCMPHTACQMCRIVSPPSSPSSFCDANVDWRRCCNLRISNCCWPPADFCHCVACPAKGTLHSGGHSGKRRGLSDNCYCYCCYLCCCRRCCRCWCCMKCAMRLYCQ